MAFDRTDTQSAQVVPSSRTTPRLIDTWTGFGCLQAPPDRHPGTGLCRLQANRRGVCASHPTPAARPTDPISDRLLVRLLPWFVSPPGHGQCVRVTLFELYNLVRGRHCENSNCCHWINCICWNNMGRSGPERFLQRPEGGR